MNFNDLREYCLQQKGAIEDFPFGFGTHVMKVGGKMFAILAENEQVSFISLKCNPDISVVLRELHPSVKPGYHLNKKHWNTIEVDGSITDEELQKMIEHSYELVFKSLKKAERAAIEQNLTQIAD